jgi:hypothetical protein
LGHAALYLREQRALALVAERIEQRQGEGSGWQIRRKPGFGQSLDESMAEHLLEERRHAARRSVVQKRTQSTLQQPAPGEAETRGGLVYGRPDQAEDQIREEQSDGYVEDASESHL